MNIYEFIEAEKANHAISTLCRVLMVSRSAFYEWRANINWGRSARAREDELLATHIRAIHTLSRGSYGSPRVHAQLLRQGFRVSRKRVIRLMKAQDLRAQKRKQWKATTVRDPDQPPAPNLLERDFTTTKPNRVWVADITYVSTVQGWLFVAAILDLFSRRVVGWAAAPHMRTDLVLDAWHRAVERRRNRVSSFTPIEGSSSRASRFKPPWRDVARCLR